MADDAWMLLAGILAGVVVTLAIFWSAQSMAFAPAPPLAVQRDPQGRIVGIEGVP